MVQRYLTILLFFSFLAPCFPHSASKPAFKSTSSTSFIENKGQIIDQNNKPNPAVLYLLNTPGMNVQLRRGGFSYDLYRISNTDQRFLKSEVSASRVSRLASRDSIEHPASTIYYHRIDFDLAGSNPDCEIITSESSADYLNYYTAGTPVEGVTNVRSYKTVTCKNIYPAIDLEFVSGDGNQFKYTFIVRPGGSLASIRFKVSGPDNIIEKGNDLLINTSAGDIEEVIPLCYYSFSDDDSKTPVTCRFKKEFNNLYSFSTGDEIPENAILYIDPIPTRRWGTYFGGLQWESLGSVCQTDDQGNIFLSGSTSSTTNIATAGAYQTVLTGEEDAFLAKFSNAGQQLWGTYYGGTLQTIEFGLTLDPEGNIYMCGYTSSTTNMATPGAYQTILRGENDAFLAKFTAAGFRIWGTYYGGNEGVFPGRDEFTACSVDTPGNIYCFGQTSSPDYISTPGAHQTVLGGLRDDMLVKFTSDGERLWGTYYGGSGDEMPAWGTIGKNGMVYIAGSTKSSNNISTPGSYQPAYSGWWDSFMACFLPDGIRQWGTYYGGMLDDITNGCAADTGNSIYIYGATISSSGIATSGTFQPALIGFGNNGFIAKFSADGQRLWGTYDGYAMFLNGMAVDDSGYIFIAGQCAAQDPSDFSPRAYQTIFGGNMDATLGKFTGNGQRVWGTYYGGPLFDYGFGCAVDHYDNIYLAGYSDSDNNSDNNTSLCSRNPLANIIATPGSHQQNLSGEGDVFLIKFADCWSPDTALQINGPTALCQNSTGVVFSIDPILSATDYHWCVTGDLTITAGQNTTSITVDVGSTLGIDTISVYGINSCDTGFPKVITRRVYQRPVPMITGTDTTCTGFATLFTTKSGKINYQWTVSPGGTIVLGGTATDSTCTVTWSIGGAQWIRLNYSETTGCNALVPTQFNVWVNAGPPVSVSITSSSNPVCIGTSVTYTAIGVNEGSSPVYHWKVNGIDAGTNSTTFMFTPNNGDIITCLLTSNIACGSGNPATSNSITMSVVPFVPVNIAISSSGNPVCTGTSVTFTAATINGGPTPFYQWKVNGAIVGLNLPTYTYNPVSGDLVSCILTSNILCPTGNPATSNTITMIVNPNLPVSIAISASANPFCQGTSVTFTATPTNGGTLPFFQWKVNGVNVGSSSPTYTYNPASGDLVSCILNSNIACPTGNPATSNSITMIVNVNLPAGINISASTNPFCPGNSVTFTAATMYGGPTPFYQWKVNGANVGTDLPTYTYNPASGDLVSCIMTSNLACVTGNPSTSNTIIMSGTLAPIVTLTLCNDTITTNNAKPFKLKGGIPLGGTYSGAGVAGGIFNPAIAGVGNHQITYSYTNAALCSANAHSFLHIFNPSILPCGSPLTDIRDNKVYPTVQIGSQCWMAENLDYGYTIDESTNQRDNCIPEKYIRNSSSVIRNSYYQWDEIMQYDETVSTQGLCPPGWHVPIEADWNTLFGNYISNGFAGSPLKYSGFSGFNAILSGARHLNKNWDYQGFATFFWSSTAHGPLKAWGHGMNDTDPSVSIYPSFRDNAFSVRCIKD